MIKKEASQQDVAKAIRKMIIGVLVIEYAFREIKDIAQFELKRRVVDTMRCAVRVQDLFIHHPHTKDAYRDQFKKEFLSSEMLLIGELLESVWGLKEDDLELIINSIKNNTEDVKPSAEVAETN